MPYTVLTAFGTRPEAIKLAPVIQAVEADPDRRSRVLVMLHRRKR
jgi:UDP-N-acetylglucosamine 2-epimerase (non-hydrolysing)